jgi:superfamily II DNA/RNA helicase
LMLLHAICKTETSATIPIPSIQYLVLDEADVLLDLFFGHRRWEYGMRASTLI